MSEPLPTDEDLDAAAVRFIERMATILYIEEMSDSLRVRQARSRRQIRERIRATYKRWVDIERIDRKMGWK